MITLISLSGVMFLVGLLMIALFFQGEKPDLSKLPTPYGAVILLDNNDRIIENDEYASSKDISPYIKDAFVALEDKRFYRHNGIDPIRLLGAALEDVKTGRFSQGGSTITCQLVKNTHLTGEKTLKRKLKEGRIALGMEKIYSKDEILEMYLNVVYFGKGIYGVKNACRSLFDKEPSEVTPIEAASLAATVANPKRYSPLLDIGANSKRAKIVLELMHRQGMLSESLYRNYANSEIVIKYSEFHNNYNKSYANFALSEYKELLSSGTIIESSHPAYVHTYLDPIVQKEADLARLEYDTGANVELIIVDNLTGGVVALSSNTNAVNRKRQPGSLLKPFIYASAIEEGILLPNTPLLDQPKNFNGYHPANYRDAYYGWIDAKEALARSANSCAVEVLSRQGTEIAYDRIVKSGIPLDLRDKNLALALGGTTYGSTIKEICSGYLTLANQGNMKSLRFIRKITDACGRTVYKPHSYGEKQAFSKESAFLLTQMLCECAKNGTAKQLGYLSVDVAAKTGTVAKGNGNSDAWCAGYTTRHTFVCRYSAEAQEALASNVSGGNHPTKTIRSLLRALYKENKPAPFDPPTTLRKIVIDKTIKEKMHLLVPANPTWKNEGEIIYAPRNYTFDSVDPEALFLSNTTVSPFGNSHILSFDKQANVSYRVRINGKDCPELSDGFYIEKQRFPLVKIDIFCKKDGVTLFQKTKILRLA